MSFNEAVRSGLSNWSKFDGRATRSEFWWFYLFTVIVAVVAYIPGLILLLIGGAASGDDGSVIGTLFIILGVIFIILLVLVVIALYIPLLAVGCRRLHDRGMTGWLQLLMLVPCGSIVLLVFWVMEGTPGDNEYGPKPIA